MQQELDTTMGHPEHCNCYRNIYTEACPAIAYWYICVYLTSSVFYTEPSKIDEKSYFRIRLGRSIKILIFGEKFQVVFII